MLFDDEPRNGTLPILLSISCLPFTVAFFCQVPLFFSDILVIQKEYYYS